MRSGVTLPDFETNWHLLVVLIAQKFSTIQAPFEGLNKFKHNQVLLQLASFVTVKVI